MKTILALSLFFMLGTGLSAAQDNRDASVTRNENPDRSEHHNWSWVGLLGLAGFNAVPTCMLWRREGIYQFEAG